MVDPDTELQHLDIYQIFTSKYIHLLGSFCSWTFFFCEASKLPQEIQQTTLEQKTTNHP